MRTCKLIIKYGQEESNCASFDLDIKWHHDTDMEFMKIRSMCSWIRMLFSCSAMRARESANRGNSSDWLSRCISLSVICVLSLLVLMIYNLMILADDDIFVIPLSLCLCLFKKKIFMRNNFPSSYSFKVCMWFAMSFRYSCVWMAHFSQRQKVRHHNWQDVRFSQNPFGMCNYWKLLLGEVLISIWGRRNYTFPFSVAARAVTADRRERERESPRCLFWWWRSVSHRYAEWLWHTAIKLLCCHSCHTFRGLRIISLTRVINLLLI